ncbi:hypothetical protein AAVH_18031 [Aphelenchoides avenae]|nr:hypothetical protein AAVH_18031 [Aphelenchus avenae]
MGLRKCYAWAYVEKVGDFCACLLCGKVYSSGTGIHGIIPHLEHPHGLFAEVHAQPKRVAEILREHDIEDLHKRRKEVRKQLRTGDVPTHPSASAGSVKRNRQRASFIWHYAERVGGVTHCLICGKQSRAARATASSDLPFHLESHHGITKALHFEHPEKVTEMLKEQGVSDIEERRRSVRGQPVKPSAESKPAASTVKNELINTSVHSSSDSDDDSDVELIGSGARKRLQKKLKAKQSFVWAYFAKFANSKECLICGARLAAVSPTSGEYHLRDRHDITRQRHETNEADILRHLKENDIDLEANRRAAMEAEELRLQRAGIEPQQAYRPPTPPVSPKKEKTKTKKQARSTAVSYWRYDDEDSTAATEKHPDVVPPKRKRDHPSSELEVMDGMDHVGVDFATKIEKNKHALSTAVSYWRYDDDGSTPAIVKQPDVVPPMQKRCRPRKLDSVQSLEADAGHVEAEFEAAPAATASANSGIARLEKEIEEDKERLKKLRAELIALEFEEASFLNSGPVSGPVTAAKQTDIRQYCEVMRRENVASTKKQVELIQPSTRQATIGEFFKTV